MIGGGIYNVLLGGGGAGRNYVDGVQHQATTHNGGEGARNSEVSYLLFKHQNPVAELRGPTKRRLHGGEVLTAGTIIPAIMAVN